MTVPRVVTEELDEPVDLDRFVRRYVELVLEAEGIEPSRGPDAEPPRNMGTDRPIHVARSH